MHQQCFRVGGLDPRQQAVRQMRALAGHRQKPVRLVHNQNFVIGVQDFQRQIGRRIAIAHNSLPKSVGKNFTDRVCIIAVKRRRLVAVDVEYRDQLALCIVHRQHQF